MPDLTIRSNKRSDQLVLAADVKDYWRATAEFGEMTASVRFYEPSMHLLAAYFARLAEAWRGWDGEQVWRPLEGDCHLAATHDGLGSIGLALRLRMLADRPDHLIVQRWLVEGTLVIDAGSLDDLTTRAQKLLD